MVEISCSVKAPVYLSVDSASITKSSSGDESRQKSGCQVIEVQLREPKDISVVRFRNNYTYTVSVLYQSSVKEHQSSKQDIGDINKWKVGVANVILMESCHCDSPGAQKWVELGKDVFKNTLENVIKLRLILRQPSPCWKEFGIESITCYSCHGDNSMERLSTESRDHQEAWSSWNKVEKLLEVGQTAHSVLMSEKENTTNPLSHRRTTLPYEINLLSF